MRDQNYSFGWLFFQRLGRLAPTLFPALYSSATLFVLATLATSICSEVVGYYIGLAPSKFIVALGGRDQPTFWRWFMWGSLMFFGKCLCIAGVEFFSWLLYTSWRRNIDSALHVNYFKNFAFYRVNCLEYADGSQIDNPDQRITQDVERMTQQLAVNILPAALIGPFVVVFYTYKTWTTAGWLGVSLIYAYFLIGTTVNKLLISPMVKWVARQEKMEGNFRFKHVSVRTNAESIAFYRGEQFENAESDQHLNLLLKTQVRLIAWRLPIRFWQQFFDYYGSMISYAIQLIPIFVLNEYDGLSGLDLTGKISENAFIYIYLVNSFSRLTDVSVFVGDLAGTLHRVVELFELLGFDRGQQNSAFIQENPESVAVTSLMTTTREECIYRLQGVSYSLPTDPNYRLMEGLTITINTGRNLLVTGQSSSGKTSLLRVLAGFWDIDSGMLERKLASNRSVYLPQKPYFPCGKLTLRQQIHYPRRLLPNGIIDHTENARIGDLLKSLKLDDMIARCGGLDTPVEWDWQETLTPGEQQRLTIVRVLYRKPAIAILDEATSSVSSDCEADIYRLLRANGITFVSAGHRPSLLQFHEIELHLDGKTGYTIKELASNT